MNKDLLAVRDALTDLLSNLNARIDALQQEEKPPVTLPQFIVVSPIDYGGGVDTFDGTGNRPVLASVGFVGAETQDEAQKVADAKFPGCKAVTQDQLDAANAHFDALIEAAKKNPPVAALPDGVAVVKE